MSSVIINLPCDTTPLGAEMDTKPAWVSDVEKIVGNVWKQQKNEESSKNATTSCDSRKEINCLVFSWVADLYILPVVRKLGAYSILAL